MEVKTRVRREDKIAVMFSSGMRQRLNVLAEGFGMPPSTLCAFAVATWVQQQENALAMTRNAVSEMVSHASEAMDATMLDDVAMASLKAVARSVDSQGLLPLDD